MPHPTMHVDRVRAALAATVDYRPTFGHMVDVDEQDPRGYRCCFAGVFADVARLAGARIELVFTRHGAQFKGRELVWFDLRDWYGLDLASVLIRPAALPPHLARVIETVVSATRERVPAMELTDALEQVDELGFTLWRLSDYGVPFWVLADAMRWTLDLDRHLVLERAPRSVPGRTEQVAA